MAKMMRIREEAAGFVVHIATGPGTFEYDTYGPYATRDEAERKAEELHESEERIHAAIWSERRRSPVLLCDTDRSLPYWSPERSATPAIECMTDYEEHVTCQRCKREMMQ